MEPGAEADYAYDTLADSEWGEAIVPFDSDGSLLAITDYAEGQLIRLSPQRQEGN